MSEYRKLIVECAFIAKTYIEGLGDQSEDSGIIGRGVQRAILDAFPINDPNPASVQSAEEALDEVCQAIASGKKAALAWIESRDASQRQEGREEALAEAEGTALVKLRDERIELAKRYAELVEALKMYADERFYFPRSLILLAQERGVRLAPCYSEFGERARKALSDLDNGRKKK